MNVGRIVRTVRYLKPQQIWFQVWRRVQRVLESHPKCGSEPLGEFAFLNLAANPKGWNKLRVEYDNVGFFHGYYVRKGYTTLFRIPNWLGRILT